MIGVGFTVIEKVCTAPEQPLADAVTVNTPIVGTVPVLVAVNEAMDEPPPDAPMPIVVLLLAHVYVVPPTLDVNTSEVVLALLHTVWAVGVTVITGTEFTDTVTVPKFVQPAAVPKIV